MKAIDFLKRRELGFVTGSNRRVRSRRDWRGFLLFLIAGGRTVVMNADLRDGRLDLRRSPGARVANNQLGTCWLR